MFMRWVAVLDHDQHETVHLLETSELRSVTKVVGQLPGLEQIIDILILVF